ncbi:hypothetical protein BDN72DRAFT_936468 [Pluteus cervinus]|uniref:Uncharacterized protein n=1 Tax=Pluteus cervinus TaxID=181527 RepID=A0ACD3A6M8_9AGAR|nr:hypothetical protein BDN72DRAFT_936468 [Pluteus cervinus]
MSQKKDSLRYVSRTRQQKKAVPKESRTKVISFLNLSRKRLGIASFRTWCQRVRADQINANFSPHDHFTSSRQLPRIRTIEARVGVVMGLTRRRMVQCDRDERVTRTWQIRTRNNWLKTLLSPFHMAHSAGSLSPCFDTELPVWNSGGEPLCRRDETRHEELANAESSVKGYKKSVRETEERFYHTFPEARQAELKTAERICNGTLDDVWYYSTPPPFVPLETTMPYLVPVLHSWDSHPAAYLEQASPYLHHDYDFGFAPHDVVHKTPRGREVSIYKPYAQVPGSPVESEIYYQSYRDQNPSFNYFSSSLINAVMDHSAPCQDSLNLHERSVDELSDLMLLEPEDTESPCSSQTICSTLDPCEAISDDCLLEEREHRSSVLPDDSPPHTPVMQDGQLAPPPSLMVLSARLPSSKSDFPTQHHGGIDQHEQQSNTYLTSPLPDLDVTTEHIPISDPSSKSTPPPRPPSPPPHQTQSPEVRVNEVKDYVVPTACTFCRQRKIGCSFMKPENRDQKTCHPPSERGTKKKRKTPGIKSGGSKPTRVLPKLSKSGDLELHSADGLDRLCETTELEIDLQHFVFHSGFGLLETNLSVPDWPSDCKDFLHPTTYLILCENYNENQPPRLPLQLSPDIKKMTSFTVPFLPFHFNDVHPIIFHNLPYHPIQLSTSRPAPRFRGRDASLFLESKTTLMVSDISEARRRGRPLETKNGSLTHGFTSWINCEGILSIERHRKRNFADGPRRSGSGPGRSESCADDV